MQTQDGAPVTLTRGSLLARNTVFNLFGKLLPLFVAVVAMPILIRDLGTDRFGALTLAWMVIGYYSLFDLGLGRALTKVVSEKLGADKSEDIPALVWTALLLMLLLGVLGGVVVSLLSPLLVYRWLNIPTAIQGEVLWSFYLLAFSIPFVTSGAGLQGVLEAKQRFGLANAVRIPLGIFSFCGPLLVLPFSRNLAAVIAVLVAGRLLAWWAFLDLCFRVTPGLRHKPGFHRGSIRPLLQFGGWMTVSNLVTPLILALDRFLIGALLSLQAVAYFTTPYEVVTRLLVIPSAFVGVLFPAFSTSFATDRGRTTALFTRGVKYLFLGLFPLALIVVVFGFEGLNLWLGPAFAENSTRVLQWLTIAVFLNGMALVPLTLVQGVGRPDLTAKLHLCELPVYLALLWWLLKAYGIEGAAFAALLRVVIDALFLFGMAGRIINLDAPARRRIALVGVVSLAMLVLTTIRMSLPVKIPVFLAILFVFFVGAWVRLIAPEERTALLRAIRKPGIRAGSQ